MKTTTVVCTLLGLLLAGCGNAATTSPANPSTTPAEAAMNIHEGQTHYRKVISEIMAGGTCGGTPLAWTELRPEDIEGADSDDEGNFTAYVYRGPFLGSDVPCTGADFTREADRIAAIIEKSGGIADDVVLDGDYAHGGEVKWRDAHDATFTFSSGAKTSFSMVSGQMPKE